MKDLINQQYNHLFQGIGKIEDKKDNKEILGQFFMRPKPAVLVAQKLRQVLLSSRTIEDVAQPGPTRRPL